ncbi:MAG: hypothetical protein M1833_005981 [Piccolia ochrophora]|nr:MAG: hypothetical protein M1833_005981 [Piccolia ochrophora]
MHLPLLPREQPPVNGTRNTLIFVAVAIGIFGTFAAILIIYFVLRRVRVKHPHPRYIPTDFLKRKWRNWSPDAYQKSNYRYSMDSAADGSQDFSNRRNRRTETSTAATVDRNTSVRSVMTLPAYKPTPGDTEQVLGREGERGGIDRVVDFPETGDEEETRRDAHMESLYQIRRARRNRAAERAELRRQEDEAREGSDFAALERIRRERRRLRNESNPSVPPVSGSNASLPTNDSLSVEAATRPDRGRRISSVSYADVGLARHDGSRVRDSSESDRPLLESAASMGNTNSRPNSRRRDRSVSSNLSISTNASEIPASVRNAAAAADVGSQSIPDVPAPPQYEELRLEDAPPYESPSRTDAPRLPALATLPAIEITAGTPMANSPVTPVRAQ